MFKQAGMFLDALPDQHIGEFAEAIDEMMKLYRKNLADVLSECQLVA